MLLPLGVAVRVGLLGAVSTLVATCCAFVLRCLVASIGGVRALGATLARWGRKRAYGVHGDAAVTICWRRTCRWLDLASKRLVRIQPAARRRDSSGRSHGRLLQGLAVGSQRRKRPGGRRCRVLWLGRRDGGRLAGRCLVWFSNRGLVRKLGDGLGVLLRPCPQMTGDDARLGAVLMQILLGIAEEVE